jgi:cytochrome c oxidase cbb3-type subunit I/II
MIRSNVADVLRYGPASQPDESIFDHPFQWGSKRTGPDLARIGRKYPDLWHFRHLRNPRDVVPQSIMPDYPWLFSTSVDFAELPRKLAVMQSLGVPYLKTQVDSADEDARAQAKAIAKDLENQGAPPNMERTEVVALIAYLQALGQMGTQTRAAQ